jgi:hypothetical protein
MNEREKLEMVKMCVDALLEVKPLDRCIDGEWDKYELSSYPLEDIQMIAEAIDDEIIFRIAKPTKKVRYRLYKWSMAGVSGVSASYDEDGARINSDHHAFRGWIGDWQEVEIEE